VTAVIVINDAVLSATTSVTESFNTHRCSSQISFINIISHVRFLLQFISPVYHPLQRLSRG